MLARIMGEELSIFYAKVEEFNASNDYGRRIYLYSSDGWVTSSFYSWHGDFLTGTVAH